MLSKLILSKPTFFAFKNIIILVRRSCCWKWNSAWTEKFTLIISSRLSLEELNFSRLERYFSILCDDIARFQHIHWAISLQIYRNTHSTKFFQNNVLSCYKQVRFTASTACSQFNNSRYFVFESPFSVLHEICSLSPFLCHRKVNCTSEN